MVALHVPKAPLAPGVICCLLNFQENGRGKLFWRQTAVAVCLWTAWDSSPNPRDLRAHFPDFSSTGHCRHCSSFVTRRNMPCPLCLFLWHSETSTKMLSIVSHGFPPPPHTSAVLLIYLEAWLFYSILYIKGFHVSCAAKQKQGSNSLEHGVFLPSLTYFGIWNTSTALKITMCSTDLYKFALMFSTSVSILPERA